MTWTRLDQYVLGALKLAMIEDPHNEKLRQRYKALDARRDDEAPDCPQCGCGLYVQKCPFDMGGSCPRHEARTEWEASLP